jgi:hypothetical protein
MAGRRGRFPAALLAGSVAVTGFVLAPGAASAGVAEPAEAS